MGEKTAFLRCRVSPEKKRAFVEKAASLGRNESDVIDWLVDQFLASDQNEGAGDGVEGDPMVRDKKVGTLVNAAMKNDIQTRMRRMGVRSESTFLYQLIKAHLSKEASFTEKELDEIQLGRNELSALGRNISQIAKVLNASPVEAQRAYGIQLDRVGDAIKNYRDSVGRLMRANIAAWGVEVTDEKF